MKLRIKNLAALIVIMLSCCALAACGSDDNDDEPLVPEETARDILSNTSWKLQSITGGWNEAYSDDWAGEILKFGPDGTVTEVYVEGGSGTGTYTLDGNELTLNGIAWNNSFGSKFTYTLSGNSLKLKNDLNSTFNFVKL